MFNYLEKIMKKREWINVPNTLTSIRILLSPAVLAAYFTKSAKRGMYFLWLVLAAGITDCLDGFFARKLNQVTKLGKILDPIADKLMMATLLFCLACSGYISWALLIIIIVKELYMAVGAGICLKRNLTVASDLYGKIATLLFYPSVLLTWPWHRSALAAKIGSVMLWAAIIMSVIASAHYTLESLKQWKTVKKGLKQDVP